MRRLNDERGAAAVVATLCMTAVLGAAALSVDVGKLHAEKRELQNGADAAVLAMAEDCAAQLSHPGCGSDPAADVWLDANASDGTARVVDLDVDPTGRSVTLRAGAVTDGRNGVPMTFASVFGARRRDVRVSATAAWGYPASKPTHPDGAEYPSLPLTVDGCEYDDATSKGRVFGQYVVIVFHQGGGGGDDVVTPCTTNASGQDSPGNFGWISRASDCQAAAEGIGNTGGDNGNSPPHGCEDEFNRLLGREIVLPMFRRAWGNGSHATYQIVGWSTFHLTGYKLGGSGAWERPAGNPPCSGGDRCIGGWFVKESVEADPGGENFGTSSVSLTKSPKVQDGPRDGDEDAPAVEAPATEDEAPENDELQEES